MNPENQIYTTAPDSSSRFFPPLSLPLHPDANTATGATGVRRRRRWPSSSSSSALPHLPLTSVSPSLSLSPSLLMRQRAREAAAGARWRRPCGRCAGVGGARLPSYLSPILLDVAPQCRGFSCAPWNPRCLSLPLSLSPSLSIYWTIAVACRRLRPNCARSCVPTPDLGFYMSRIFSFCIDSIFVFTIDFCFQGSNGDVLSIYFLCAN